MSGVNSKISILLILTLLLSLVTYGCSQNGGTTNNQQSNAASDENSNTNSTADQKAGERVQLTMFMTNSGLAYPEGVDPSNNAFINLVEDYANVDLELDVPPYAYFITKYNLLLASNDLPDIMYGNITDQTRIAAEQGAFLDLRPFYSKSATIQKWITPIVMDLLKSNDGKNYFLPHSTINMPQGIGQLVRYDLIVKYNDRKWPETIAEWVNFLETVKKANPNAIPISPQRNDPLFNYAQTFWNYFGVNPVIDAPDKGFRIQDGKVVSDFTLPEYREALFLWKQLYEDGILDREFTTTDINRWISNFQNNMITMITDNADQLSGYISNWGNQPALKDARYVFAPPLKTYPSVLKDTKYAKMSRAGFGATIWALGGSISAKTKYPQQACRVLEGFCQDSLYQAIFWGNEGKEYVVKEGKRIIVPEMYNDKNRKWALHLSIFMGFGAGTEASDENITNQLGAEDARIALDSRKVLQNEAKDNGPGAFSLLTPKLPDDVKMKLADASAFQSVAITKVIMGKIEIEDFDKLVHEYKSRYGFIDDAYTKLLIENKSDLLAMGVKEAGW